MIVLSRELGRRWRLTAWRKTSISRQCRKNAHAHALSWKKPYFNWWSKLAQRSALALFSCWNQEKQPLVNQVFIYKILHHPVILSSSFRSTWSGGGPRCCCRRTCPAASSSSSPGSRSSSRRKLCQVGKKQDNATTTTPQKRNSVEGINNFRWTCKWEGMAKSRKIRTLEWPCFEMLRGGRQMWPENDNWLGEGRKKRKLNMCQRRSWNCTSCPVSKRAPLSDQGRCNSGGIEASKVKGLYSFLYWAVGKGTHQCIHLVDLLLLPEGKQSGVEVVRVRVRDLCRKNPP